MDIQALKKIVNTYRERQKDFEYELTNLSQNMRFFGEHKFEEELRIARVKYAAMQDAVYTFKEFITSLDKLINDNS